MKLDLRILIFILSFLLLAIIIFINYKIGEKRGLKKSLYSITYRSICVIFAFLLAPYINEYVLNYDLYQIEKAIRYNGLHFYRIIDFIEEVIVHNEVLNDIYNFFPSLKNLLMDFPQVLFIPFAYVLTFILISILLLPLYWFLSYKRKRRVLYDKPYNNKGKVFAGIINSIQSLVLISIILTPVNGLSRIYKYASKELIDSESNICRQNEYLSKYEVACKIIEGYNSSVFAFLAENPVSEYVYDSLTRINYGDKETSLNDEVINIARAGIILNKTGLLTAINIKDFEDVSSLNFNGLSDEEIDVMIEAFEQSLYTREIVYEVYEWSKEYLDWLLQDFVDSKHTLNYNYEDVMGELKIILKAINYILNNENFLNSINKVYQIIDEYVNETKYYASVDTETKLFFDVVYAMDFDALQVIYSYLKESKIYNEVVPRILENILQSVGFQIEFTNMIEFNQVVVYGIEMARIISNHRYVYDVLHLLNDLSIEEVHYIGEFLEYLHTTDELLYLAKDAIDFGIKEARLELDIPTELLYEIKYWDRELELGHLVIQIVYKAINTGEIDYSKAWYGLTHYSDTIIFESAFKFLIKMLPDVFTMWLAGKDYKYLVGEYVK